MSFLTMLVVMYWLPTIVAVLRQAHSALGVFLLNLFLGWTGIFWILALVWSLAADNRTIIHVDRGEYGPR